MNYKTNKNNNKETNKQKMFRNKKNKIQINY